MRIANIDIHLSALSHNLNRVRTFSPTSKILAMVKANAYGHGSIACLPALQAADALGVATFDEAMQLRDNHWHKPIVMIEGVFSEDEWQQTLAQDISCVIHQPDQVKWALKHSYSSNSAIAHHQHDSLTANTLWLKVNTGMNRLGFAPEQIEPIAKLLHAKGYQIVLTSHFANADDKHHPSNSQQCQIFAQLLSSLQTQISPDIQGSLCNSAGIVNFPEYQYDWVRPGIMLYGSSPVADKTADELGLQSVMTFSATLMAIDDIDANVAVGYGSRYVSKQPLQKGIVTIGYGDGYPRVISEQTWVGLISREDGTAYRCPIIGRVAMDMIAIDLSAVPHPQIGDDIILWGNNNGNTNPHHINTPHIDTVASWANTISYELLCRLTTRPTRRVC